MREIKYSGKYIELTEENIEGHVYERAALRPGVRVYPICENKILIMCEHRRHEGRSRWKFVGGWLDKEQKTELEVAQEELLEELGYEAHTWNLFHVFDTGKSTVGLKATYYVAQGLVKHPNPPQNPDSDFVSDTKWVTLDELFSMIDNHDLIWDNDALAGVQALRQFGKNN